MTERTMGTSSRHFAGVWLGVGDKQGREKMGVRLNDNREVIVHVSANGRQVTVTLDGQKMVVKK